MLLYRLILIYKSQFGHITYVEIDHKIISMVILLLLLIQEGQLSITVESMCTKCWLTTKRTKPAQEKCEQINWSAQHDLNSVDCVVKLRLKQIYTHSTMC